MANTRSEGYTLSLNVILVNDPVQGGFTAFFKQFPYIIAEGDNEGEAMKNLMNAMHDVVDHLSNNLGKLI